MHRMDHDPSGRLSHGDDILVRRLDNGLDLCASGREQAVETA